MNETIKKKFERVLNMLSDTGRFKNLDCADYINQTHDFVVLANNSDAKNNPLDIKKTIDVNENDINDICKYYKKIINNKNMNIEKKFELLNSSYNQLLD